MDAIPSTSKPHYRLFAAFVLLSLVLHLLLIQQLPRPIPENNKTIQDISIQLQQIDEPPPIQAQPRPQEKVQTQITPHIIRNPPPQTKTPTATPKSRPSAALLLQRSEQFIQQQEKHRPTDKPILGVTPIIDPRMIDPQLAQRLDAKLNTNRSYGDRWLVEIPSIFGGTQCFEVIEENALNSFSEETWFATQC